MEEIVDSIKQNDLIAYQHSRYPDIPDSDPLAFYKEDFSDVDFSKFSAGFFEFNDCLLDNVRGLYGQPITINGGSARNIDLCGAHAIIKATECDFTGMQYDDDTQLAYGEKGVDARSEFNKCTLDAETKLHFERQGVRFDNI